MKKFITKVLLVLLLPFLSMIGYSSWIIVADKTENVNLNTNTTAVDVCYINTDTDGNRYTSIERALQVAKSGDVVHVYLDSKAGTKTIKNDCVIKSGVTLNIANDTSYKLVTKNSDGTVEATQTGGSLKNNAVNTVVLTEGKTITNYGTLMLGGVLSGGGGGTDYAGHTFGAYGKIVLGESSKINSYGDIVCCGYIDEESFENNSSVNVISGTLGLPFIVRDTRGGSITYALYSGINTYKCNLFNQFEMINITSKITIYDNGSIESYANLFILNNNAALVGLIGNSSSDFMQLSAGSYVNIKYNKNSEITQYDFYGGMIFNELKMNLNFTYSGISVPINLKTSDVYFPLTWRMNITLNKYPGQSGIASYSASNQRLKLMPGHKLIVNEGCKFVTPDVNVYTHFADIGPVAGSEYPSLPPAEFIVYGQYQCTGNFGGRIIRGNNTPESNIITSGTSLITFEAYSIKDGSLIAALKEVDQMLAISEVKTVITYSEFVNNKYFAAGIIQTTNSNSLSFTSSYSTTIGTTTQTFTTNKCLTYPSGTNLKVDLINNVSTATWNDVAFVKNTEITLNDSGIFELTKSSSNIGNVKVSGITISGATEVKIEESITLTATINNASNAYTKTVCWESLNQSIATVDSNGVVTGVSAGTATIKAISNDGDKISGTYNVEVKESVISIQYYGSVTNGVYSSTANGAPILKVAGDSIVLNSALADYRVIVSDKNGVANAQQNWFKFIEWKIVLVNIDGTETIINNTAGTTYTIPENFEGENINIYPIYPETPSYYKYKLTVSGESDSISSTSGIVTASNTTYWISKDDKITVKIRRYFSDWSYHSKTCTLVGATFDGTTDTSFTCGGNVTSSAVSKTFTMPDNSVTVTIKKNND